MPNYCQNRMMVSGPEEDVDAFTRRANAVVARDGRPTEQVLAFYPFVPVPENLVPDGDLLDRLWGTTSEPVGPTVTEEEDFTDDAKRLSYDFLTPWTPPLAFVQAVGAMYPTLTLSLMYCEMGERFRGEVVIADGAVIHEVRGEVRDLDLLVWDSAC